MNREILFRGKRKDNGEWIFGSLVHQLDHYGKPVDRYFILDGDYTNDYDIDLPIEVNSETVGEYSGFADKNGVKIFSDDIIKADETTDYALGVVKYGEYATILGNEATHIGFYVDWIVKVDNYFLRRDLGYWFPKSEVVGNIHDNSELLKEENENGK